MKTKFYSFFLIFFLVTQISFAQMSPGFNYQAVIRDSSGVVANTEVALKFSIVSTFNDEIVYVEEQMHTTDAFGLLNCQIGKGEPVEGEFDFINWDDDLYSVKIEYKFADDPDFMELGMHEFSSVPYAKFAESVGHIDGQDVIVTNYDGETRAELNYFDNNDAGSLILYGANDSTKAILGTTNMGYSGGLWLYDSTRVSTMRLFSMNNGGSRMLNYDQNGNNIGWFGNWTSTKGIFQINEFDDASNYLGTIGGYIYDAKPNMYLETGVNNEYKTIVTLGGNDVGNHGVGGFLTLRGPALSDGSWPKDMITLNTAASDTGYSAEAFLWGDKSPNIQMGGQSWYDNNQGFFQMFGSIQNSDGWYPSDVIIKTYQDESTGHEAGVIDLYRTEGADNTESTIWLNGMYGSAGFDGDVHVGGSLTVNGDINANFQPSWGQDFQIKNYDGALRADLNYFENNDAGSLVLYGANDSTNAILGSTYQGYAGGLWLYDSTRVNTMRLTSLKNGGSRMLNYDQNGNNIAWFGSRTSQSGIFQITEYDDNSTLTGAVGAYLYSGKPFMYLETAVNGEYKTLVETGGNDVGTLGVGGFFTLRGPAMADGSWPTDVFKINSASNDTSYAAEVLMFGKNSANIQMGGRVWDNAELPYLQMFGSLQKTDGWYDPSVYLGIEKNGTTGAESGLITLLKTESAENTTETIRLDGASGNISAEGSVSVKDVLKLQPRTEPASAEAGDLYFDSSSSTLKLYDGTSWRTVSLQ